ncbi:MAG: hypothetical protein Q9217_003097 [Psora testacea]
MNVSQGRVEELPMPRATKGSLEDVGSAHSVPESAPVPDATTEIERLASSFISRFSEAKHYALSDIGSLSKGMRSKVVEEIVEGLLDHEINDFVGEWPLFDPAFHVSQLLKFDYDETCSILDLPPVGQLPVAVGTSMVEETQDASLDQPRLGDRMLTEGQWNISPSNGVTLQGGTSEMPMMTEESWRVMLSFPNGEGSSPNDPMITDESWNLLQLNTSLESRNGSYLNNHNEYMA